jgi:hypothetical protein
VQPQGTVIPAAHGPPDSGIASLPIPFISTLPHRAGTCALGKHTAVASWHDARPFVLNATFQLDGAGLRCTGAADALALKLPLSLALAEADATALESPPPRQHRPMS